MPQTSDEMRDLMFKWFGDPIDLSGPCKVLVSRGWTLTKTWGWEPSVPNQTIHEIDWLLMKFLIEEWDFGSSIQPPLEY